MIYLTGAAMMQRTRDAISSAGGRLGYLATPTHGRRLGLINEYPWWAADNGCFAQGERFDLAAYYAWLDHHAPAQGHCLFAVAPDVLGDPVATLARSLPVLPELRRRGYRAALVAQDGLERLPVPWDAFDVLFMGGSTAYKLSEPAYALMRDAKARGKWCHMGRVNSWVRLRAAVVSGYDSADGTMVAFGPDKRLAQLLGWLDTLRQQGRLDLWDMRA